MRSGRSPNELTEFQIAEACKPIKRQILYNNTAFPDNINIKVDNTKEGFTTYLQFPKIYQGHKNKGLKQKNLSPKDKKEPKGCVTCS